MKDRIELYFKERCPEYPTEITVVEFSNATKFHVVVGNSVKFALTLFDTAGSSWQSSLLLSGGEGKWLLFNNPGNFDIHPSFQEAVESLISPLPVEMEPSLTVLSHLR